MNAKDRWRGVRKLMRALHVRLIDTGAEGEPGHHAYCLAQAAEHRRRFWLHRGQSVRCERQSREFWGYAISNAKAARATSTTLTPR